MPPRLLSGIECEIRFLNMKQFIRGIFLILLFLTLGSIFYLYQNVKDRHPGYEVDISVRNNNPTTLKVGFAVQSISPTITDTWTDANNDAQFNEDDGDTYNDVNGNGKFDPIWIAGFDNKRAANGIHDELWARTIVFDDGKSRIAMTSIDAIGFMHDDVVDIRNLVDEEAGITYSVISSTHSHEAPDLLGLWGDSYLKSGVNDEYLHHVKAQTAKSIEEAVSNLQEAVLKFAINPHDALVSVNDTRPPFVYDEAMRIIQAISLEDSTTLGTLVAWADHPETIWDKNLLVSSDFPHYLREGVEQGVFLEDSLIIKGLGGTTVFFNGAIGGLMTTNPQHLISNGITDHVYLEPGFDKAQAQGDFLAKLVLESLQGSDDVQQMGSIAIRAKSIDLEFENPYFRLGALLGVLDRGMNGWMKVRSEVAAFSVGPAHFITVPGEIYPEIVNGGIEKPDGQDFDIDPQEIPPLRDFMKGEYNFIFGMANDMIGYIIPKSQWDTESPYTYHSHDAPYGEVNSLGPDTAPKLHADIVELLREFYQQ